MITNFNEFQESLSEEIKPIEESKQLMKDISDDVIINIWKNANKKNLSHKEIMGSMSQISGVSETELEKFLEKHKELIEESTDFNLYESFLEFHLNEGTKEEYTEFFLNKLKKYGVKSPADLSEEDKSNFFNEIKKEWNK